jgi:hypothetical protein
VIVLLILVLSCLIFRGLGFAGIAAFATWQATPYSDERTERRLRIPQINNQLIDDLGDSAVRLNHPGSA